MVRKCVRIQQGKCQFSLGIITETSTPPPKDCVGVRCCEDYWKKGFSRDGLHLGNIRHLDSADVFNTAISPNSVDPHDNHLTRREIKDHNLFHCSQVAK